MMACRYLRRITVDVSIILLALGLVEGALGQTRKPPAETFAALSTQAEQANQENRLDDAIALYRRALKLRPNWPVGWWSLGTIQYDHNDYKQAAAAFTRLAALQPESGSAQVMLGLCRFELGQDEEALKNIEKGKHLGTNPDPQFQNVMVYHEGILLVRKSHFEKAVEVLSSLNEKGVESEKAMLGLGMAVLRMLPKDLPAADTPGREVVLRAGKAESLAAQKKIDEAKQQYTTLVANFPNFPNIHYALGRFLLETHDVDAAIAAFQQEIANDPQNVPARLQIAAADYRLDSVAGLSYAREAVKLQPQLPFGHYLLGLLLLDTGDFQAAIPELEIARKGLTREAAVYFALGNAYARAGRKADAAQARESFKRLDKASQKDSSDGIYGRPTTDPAQDKMRGAPDYKPPA
jgi:tetratricopeptide (TPR) repeat protein